MTDVLGSLGDAPGRLHLAADLWETHQGGAPGFFPRLRSWVNATFPVDASERLLFDRVEAMDEATVKAQIRTLADSEIGSVDDDEADEALALPAAARQVRLFCWLLEEADEYECVEGEGEDEDEVEDEDEGGEEGGEEGESGEEGEEEGDDGDGEDNKSLEGEVVNPELPSI